MLQLVKKLASAVANAAAGKGYFFLESVTGGPAIKDEAGEVMLLVPRHLHLRAVQAGAISAGTSKYTMFMPFKFRLTEVIGTLKTAQTSGGVLTVDVNEAGVSVLSTKLTFDNTENTTTTAATPAVISDNTIAKGAQVTVDVDAIGDGTAADLDIWLIGYVLQ